MTYLIILGCLFILVLAFWYFGRKPVIHRNISHDDLRNYLEILLYRGYDNGYMIIRLPKDKKFKRFIQFSKYIVSNKKVGLQFDYPLAEWSMPYYKKLKLLLEKNKIDYDIERTEEEGVPEFLVIDIEKDLNKASKISILILQELYGLSVNDLVELYMVNISPKNEKIGF